MRLRPVAVLALLAAAGISSYAVLLRWRQDKPAAEPAPRPDYVLREFELLVLDEHGKESFTASGPLLERETDGRSLLVTEPRFSFPGRDGGRWLAESRRARVSPKGEQVTLLDEVQLLGPETATGTRTRFATDEITVLPEAQRARAPGAVTLTEGDSILQGRDLQAYMDERRFELLNVQGRYAPSRR